ncbi:DUF6221 family protein [Kitasatospora sp. NPDC096147]|uniref:DUF6221 family protein n=1 Tax=Kitasatospora sp. NPDC096147 TaxID=3364093 RepID=UPI00380E9525
MTDDLPGFLGARFAEDRRAATAAAPQAAQGWWSPDAGTPAERYLAHWKPARVLAELAAKQHLLDVSNAHCPSACRIEHAFADGCTLRWMGPLHEADGTRWLLDDTGARFAPPPATTDWTLRLLALPYATHPDYRPEWAPGR